MEQLELERYARLLVCTALDLQIGQPLYIEASIACEDFVCLVEQVAFTAGASDVTVRWISERFEQGRATCQNCDFRTAKADGARVESLIEQGAAYLRLESPDPSQWDAVSSPRIQERLRAEGPMRGAFRRNTDLQNVIACAATPQWAKMVFPDLDEKRALDKLWQAILNCTMAEQAEAWSVQLKQTERRKKYMDRRQYKALWLKSATADLVLGLPADQVWEGGGRTTPEGTFFMPNMPSYEVFTSPLACSAEGWVKATLPVNYQGRLIKGIYLVFREGRVVDYSAETEEALLGEILTYDENADRLGEIALVEQSTPVAQQGIIFYTTVCDENASCHLALGAGFAPCGTEDAHRRGINQSKIHVDFMFGSDDLCIWGQNEQKEWEEIFREGRWIHEL